MPLARYFFYVGGVLLALLFISDAYLPKPPAVEAVERADTDLPAIRIHSDRKWPERVVFDTSLQTITPAQSATAAASVPATAADVSAKARDAFAQLQPSDQNLAQLSDPKKPELKPQPKRKIAKKRVAPPMMLVAQQPRFGFFGNAIW